MIYITLFGINNLIKPKAHWLQHRTMHLGNICLMDMGKNGKRRLLEEIANKVRR